MRETTKTPPPLALTDALQAGFELTSKKLWLLLLPLALDSFLWLGPKLSIRPLINSLSSYLRSTPPPVGTGNVETLAALEQIGDIYNLFVQLSPTLLGVPILFNGADLQTTPLAANIIDINSIGLMLLLFLLFSAFGLVISAFFFDMLVLAVQDGSQIPRRLAQRSPLNLLQLFALAVTLLVALIVILIPVTLLAQIGALIHPILAQVVFAAAIFFAVGGLVYLLFTIHGMFFARQYIWRALYDSWRIVRANMRITIWLLVLLMGAGFVIDIVWRAVEAGTWFTIVPIFAHAFVQTSLLVATIYVYADRASRLPSTARPILT